MSFISNVTNNVAKIGGVIKKTYGPLSALEQGSTGKNYTTTTLRYPLDVGDTHLYPHTVEFQCWIPHPTTIENVTAPTNQSFRGADGQVSARSIINYALGGHQDQVIGSIKNAVNSVVQPISQTVSEVGKGEFLGPKVNQNQALNNRLIDFTRRADKSDLIAMYVPAGTWNDRINNDYTTASMNDALGDALGLAAEAGGSIAKAYEQDKSILGSVRGPIGELLAKAAGKHLGADSKILRDVGFQSMGYAINPQLEVLYGQTNMRTFQFDFMMTPRSREEAESCLAIINRFKFHASPQFTTGGAGRYLIPPSYFDIVFNYKGTRNSALPQISTCVLTSFDVNYSENEQFATYSDGVPVQMHMVMEFTELEMMHKALRELGY